MMIESPQESVMVGKEEQRYAQHFITDPQNLSFDRYAYSRYKYGDTKQANLFGQELAAGFLAKYHDFLLSSTQRFVALSSPRALIPPAAYYIFQTFLECLNRFLLSHDRPAMLEHTIQRIGTLAEDYSLLSPYERFDHLVHERYLIDKQPLTDKFLFFVDDIRITGTHEMNIIRLLENSHIYNPRLFIYYAQLINNQIPSTFEYQLNRCAFENLQQLSTIVHNSAANFRINTRILKEILRSDRNELEQFCRSIEVDFVREIYQACLACDYQNIDQFQKPLCYIQSCLQQQQQESNSHNYK